MTFSLVSVLYFYFIILHEDRIWSYTSMFISVLYRCVDSDLKKAFGCFCHLFWNSVWTQREFSSASGEEGLQVFPQLSARAPNSRAADAMHFPITRPLSLLSLFPDTLLLLLLFLLLYTFLASSFVTLRSQLHSWKRSFKTLEWGCGKVKSAEETSARQGWITSKQTVFILTGWPCDLMSTSLALA